jgi:D-3-phosphoglycerate dehydrogenase
MKWRILVTARSFASISRAPSETLTNAGCEIVMPPAGVKLDEDTLIRLLDGIDGLIAGTEPITARVLEHAPSLRIVSRNGVGLDNVDLDAARARGIVVRNTPGANSEGVAELAIGFMLATARHMFAADRQARAGNSKPVIGTELAGKTLGIVGLGSIGKLVAKRISGFEMRMLAYDPFHDDAFAQRWNVRYCTVDELLPEADVVTLHAPVTEGTRGLIGAEALARMKPTAILINTARSELVDHAALAQALRARQIAGACLDVYTHEALRDDCLGGLDNVILTPHIGAHTTEAVMGMATGSAKNMVEELARLEKRGG